MTVGSWIQSSAPQGTGIAFSVVGVIPNVCYFGRFVFAESGQFKENFPGCYASCDIESTLTYVATILLDHNVIGSLTFNTATQNATFSGPGGMYGPGSVLEIVGQAGADATLETVSITMQGFSP